MRPFRRLVRSVRSAAQHGAGVEDAVGVERLFDLAHQCQFHRIGVGFEVGDFQAADAVFGGDGASGGVDEVVDGGLDRAALVIVVGAAAARPGKTL